MMFLLLGIAITQGCLESFTGQKPAQQNHDLMWALSFSIAAISNCLLVRHLNKRPKQIVIDKATGAEFELSGLGSLFFISTKWWTHIFAAVTAIFFIRLAWP
jgi:hypothetical protein